MTYEQTAVKNLINKGELLYKVEYKLNGRINSPILTHKEMLNTIERILISNQGYATDKYELISTTPITNENLIKEVS